MAEIAVRIVAPAETWELRRAVLRPHQTIAQVAGEDTAETIALGAFEHDLLIAVGLTMPDGEPGAWRVRGMATSPQARGRGAGTAVLEALVAQARHRGARRIWCNARTRARSLYERAGFHAVSAEFELPLIGPHLVMELRTPGVPEVSGRSL